MILAVNKVFLMATYRGYTDTNSLNHFFIVFLIYCAMFIHGQHQRRYRLHAIAVSVCILLLFIRTWNGWYIFPIIMMVSLVMYSAYKGSWQILYASAFLLIFLPYRKLLPFLGNGFRITHEMARPHYDPFVLILLAALFLFILAQCRGEMKQFILLSWFSIFLIASMLALRHVQYFIPPMAVALAVLASKIRKYQVLFIILCSVFMLSLFSLEIMRSQHLPHMDDTVLEAMEWIRDNTPEDVKIMSWWDYGHIYAAYSGREVLYRGHEPRGESLRKLSSFLLSPDSKMQDRHIFIANSADLRKQEVLEKYSGMNLTEDSTIMRVLREGRCFNGTKKICLWG